MSDYEPTQEELDAITQEGIDSVFNAKTVLSPEQEERAIEGIRKIVENASLS